MNYFDNGATTFPKPPSVVRAVNAALTRYGANPGRSGHRLSLKAGEIIFSARSAAARLFGLEDPSRVIFTAGCTAALNTVFYGVLRRGDHVIISSLEHNAVARPLEALRRTRGIAVSVAKVFEGDDDKTLDSFRQAINGKTRMIVCTAASNVFGVRLPLARLGALCRVYGLLFCVDAAQGAGLLPLDMRSLAIDYLCAAGHKGLYAPMGTGILALNTAALPDSLIQGGTGTSSLELTQPQTLPERFESGTPNLPGIAGLGAGIRFVAERGEENLLRREVALLRRLYDGLQSMAGVRLYTRRPDPAVHVPVLSFNLDGRDSEEVAALLDTRFQIAVRAGLHCAPLAHQAYGTVEGGTVRAVLSAFTTPPQIDRFLQSVNKIQKLLPKKVAIDG